MNQSTRGTLTLKHAVVGLSLLCALTACAPTSPADTGSATASAPAAPRIDENPVFPETPDISDLPTGKDVIALKAATSAGPGSPTKVTTLVCQNGKSAPQSTLANAQTLCASLPDTWQKTLTGLAKASPNVKCALVYGGPSVATVIGSYQGTKITAQFSRSNGCEIAKWNLLEPLLGKPAPTITR